MTLRRILPILLLGGHLCKLTAQINYCDPNLKQDPQPQGYKLRGNRCEGYYIQPVAGGRLDIESFTQAARIDIANKTEIALAWPSLGMEAVRIRAYSLTPKQYYRMDTSRPNGETSFRWPVSLPASRNLNVGLVSWTIAAVGRTQETVYLPLLVGERNAVQGYRVVLIPSVDASEIYVTVAAVDSNGTKKSPLRNREPLKLGYYPAWRAVPVDLPLLPLGMYRADFAATWENGSSATAGMYFFSPGPGGPMPAAKSPGVK